MNRCALLSEADDARPRDAGSMFGGNGAMRQRLEAHPAWRLAQFWRWRPIDHDRPRALRLARVSAPAGHEERPVAAWPLLALQQKQVWASAMDLLEVEKRRESLPAGKYDGSCGQDCEGFLHEARNLPTLRTPAKR